LRRIRAGIQMVLTVLLVVMLVPIVLCIFLSAVKHGALDEELVGYLVFRYYMALYHSVRGAVRMVGWLACLLTPSC
jgi:hypothetical protein